MLHTHPPHPQVALSSIDFMTKTPTRKLSFQMRKTFEERLQEVKDIEEKYPNKVPVIFEKCQGERELPTLEKSKYLLPNNMLVAQFQSLFRERLQLKAHQSFFLIINKRSVVNQQGSLEELYKKEKDDDGFLYISYASQNAFGGVTTGASDS